MIRDKAEIKSLNKINSINRMDLIVSYFVGHSLSDCNSREGFGLVWISLR